MGSEQDRPLSQEENERALAFAAMVDAIDATMPPEEVRKRRYNAAIKGFVVGVENNKGPSDELRAAVKQWIDGEMTMVQLLQLTIDRVNAEIENRKEKQEEVA